MKNMKLVYVPVVILGLASSAKAQLQFSQTNLVTDNQAVNAAQISDPDLLNPWGISFSPTTPFWVSDNGNYLSSTNVTTYNVTTSNSAGLTTRAVLIPGIGNVTGQVYNANSSFAFNGDIFLFVSLDGTVSGWRSALGSTAETFISGSTANVYTGAAESTSGTNSYLDAANFRAGAIDPIRSVTTPSLTGSFTDPSLPAGYAPYNIQLLGSNLFVTYALQNSTSSAAVKGTGNGYVDEFDTQGDFLARVASNGTLNAPWGLALAPQSFGSYAGDLLVGNFGGGTINAYNLSNNSYVGQLEGTNGQPLVISGLWALTIGNGTSAGSTQDIYFTAGPNNQADGLVGVIGPVPEPSTLALLGVGVVGLLGYACRRGSPRTTRSAAAWT
jgi:uncharacterized protein (TIGR03118 family)